METEKPHLSTPRFLGNKGSQRNSLSSQQTKLDKIIPLDTRGSFLYVLSRFPEFYHHVLSDVRVGLRSEDDMNQDWRTGEDERRHL